jgi:drug/metabolite transporter (DMT)-like permease
VDVGVAVAFTASVAYSSAVVLQAAEARRVAARHVLRLSLLGHLARRPLWVAGAATGIVGWCLQAVALSYAPLTLVEPVLATTLVLLLAAGSWLLRERVGRLDVLGVLVVVGGVVGLTVSSPVHTTTHATGWGAAVSLALLAWIVVAPHAMGASRASGALIAASAGVAYGLVALTTKFASDDLSARHWRHLAGWLLLAATFGGLGLLSEMSALRSWPVTRVAPIVFGLNVAVPVLLAPTLCGERWGGSTVHFGAVVASLTAVLVGAIALARSQVVSAALATERA